MADIRNANISDNCFYLPPDAPAWASQIVDTTQTVINNIQVALGDLYETTGDSGKTYPAQMLSEATARTTNDLGLGVPGIGFAKLLAVGAAGKNINVRTYAKKENVIASAVATKDFTAANAVLADVDMALRTVEGYESVAVLNIASNVISKDKFILVSSDQYGNWWVVVESCE